MDVNVNEKKNIELYTGPLGWYIELYTGTAMFLFQFYELGGAIAITNLDAESLDNDGISRYTTNIKEKYNISFWRHSLEHSRKLEFYKVLNEHSTSDYLHQLRNFNKRRNLVKKY